MERREFLTGLGGIVSSIYFNSLYGCFASEPGELKSKVQNIYLTIDDGPTSNMRKILDFLDENFEQKVTFFTIGKNLQNEKNMRLAVEAVKKGHAVGNHSYSHPEFSNLSYEKAIKEIEEGNECVNWAYECTNRKNPKLFRFPYGDKGSKKTRKHIQEYLKENEYTQFLWDVDTLDWKYYGGKRSLDAVIKSVKNISEREIVLSHDFNRKEKISTSIEIMKYLIENRITSRALKPMIFPHTYIEMPEPEKKIDNRNVLTVVESP